MATKKKAKTTAKKATGSAKPSAKKKPSSKPAKKPNGAAATSGPAPSGLLSSLSTPDPRPSTAPPRRTYHYEGWCVLRTPLMHAGGDSLGTTRLFRPQKTVCPDGKVRKLPVYSGNALRGIWRDIATEQLLGALAIKLPPTAFDFLSSGGTLTSKGSSMDLALARRLREAVPMVGILGGGVGNQIMEGKLCVLQGTPICAETVHLLPSYCREAPTAGVSIRDLRQMEMNTRRDDKKRESMLPFLDGPAPARVEGDVATQQRFEVETLAPGACLRMGFILSDATPAEWTAFLHVFLGWLRKPFLGGRAAAGYGEVHVPALYRAERQARLCAEGTAVDTTQALATVESVIDSEDQLAIVAEQIEQQFFEDVTRRREEMVAALAEVP